LPNFQNNSDKNDQDKVGLIMSRYESIHLFFKSLVVIDLSMLFSIFPYTQD